MNTQGVYLVATVKDYNKHINPFGLALVPQEDQDHWTWFLQTTFNKRAECGFVGWLAVTANKITSYFVASWHLTRYEIAFHPAVADYLDGIDKPHRVKYSFHEAIGLPTFNEITSSLSEQANHWMGNELRSAKPIDGFYLYFVRLSKLMSEKRQMAANWIAKGTPSGLVPKMAKQISDRTAAAQMCDFTPCMKGAYSVQHLGPIRDSWLRAPITSRGLSCINLHLC
ncbi:unnamed protein product [Phytophthora lilii]|uniref:Unnamed protein product n=1 Tax=Phytophthora lilii TaxID=2077276 RepID=A0A9W6TNC6_9STRA|nr:unnamed protein product [Phytophthora lilii]